MAVEDRKLKALIVRDLKLVINEITRPMVQELLRMHLQYRRQYWEDLYNSELNKNKMEANTNISIADCFRKIRNIVDEGVEPGHTLETLQCQPRAVNGKLGVIIDVDPTNYIL